MNGKCESCNEIIHVRGNSGEAEFAVCFNCKLKFHQKCASLTSSEMKVFALKSGHRMRYYCNKCSCIIDDDDVDVKMTFMNLNTLVTNLMSENKILKDEMAALKNELEEIKLSDKSVVNDVITDENQFESFCSELADRNQRSRNILIYNIDENKQTPATQVSSNGCLNDDRETIISILSNIVDIEACDFTVSRVGRKMDDKPRPIKVVLPNPSWVLQIMRNKRNLTSQVKIVPDRTPRQRDHFKRLLSLMKFEHEKGNTNARIRYINGIPRLLTDRDNDMSTRNARRSENKLAGNSRM